MRRVTDVDSLLSVIQPAGGEGPAAYKPPSDMKKLRKTWTKDAYIEWTKQRKPLDKWTKQGEPIDKGTSLPHTNARQAKLRPLTPTKMGGQGRGK